MQFTDIASRITVEAEQLFNEMVETHLASEPGHRFFMAHVTNRGMHMQFVGQTSVPFEDQLIDEPALDDLRGYNLVRRKSTRQNTTSYNISGEAIRFHAWLRNHRGKPLESIEVAARRLVSGDAFASSHSTTAYHLEQAMGLLWSEGTADNKVAVELGMHLRSALIDVVGDLTGTTSKPEDVAGNLTGWLARRPTDRESKAIASLVQLAIDTQSLNQRVTHIRDDMSKGESPLTWEEMRRATFLTVVCCNELARL